MPQLTAAKVKAVAEPGRYGGRCRALSQRRPGWVEILGSENRRLWPPPGHRLGRVPHRGAGRGKGLGCGQPHLRGRRTGPGGRETEDHRSPPSRKPPIRSTRPTFPGGATQNTPLPGFALLNGSPSPSSANMPVDRVTRADVLAVLAPIWSTTPETARRVRQRIRTVMRWAMAHGFIENNPAGEAIDGALPPMPRVKDSLRALPYWEVSEAMKIVEASRSSASARLCLRFTVLTAARSGEARGCALERDRPGPGIVDGARSADERKVGAPGAVIQGGVGGAGKGEGIPRRVGPGFPFSETTGRTPFGHDADQNSAGHWPGAPGRPSMGSGVRFGTGVLTLGQKATAFWNLP